MIRRYNAAGGSQRGHNGSDGSCWRTGGLTQPETPRAWQAAAPERETGNILRHLLARTRRRQSTEFKLPAEPVYICEFVSRSGYRVKLRTLNLVYQNHARTDGCASPPVYNTHSAAKWVLQRAE
jgi:hypothetical protein